MELQNEILRASNKKNKIQLGAIQLAPQLIPTQTLRRSFQRALKHSSPEDFLYNDNQGHIKLRQTLSDHYAEDGIYIAKESIFITSGCMPALSTIIQVLTQVGDSIIVPMPNYNGQQLLLANLERKIVEVPASYNGIDLYRLEQTIESSGAKVCLLTANFQNPLGFCLTNEEKSLIAKLAAKYKCFIIEDDIYAECGYDLQRPLPIQYWDKEGYIFLCSSISKSLSPAYRIGWFFLPHQQDHLRAKFLSRLDIVSTPLQLGLADFINSRSYRAHLNRLRPILMEQVAEYRLFIIKVFEDLEIKLTQPQGGYSLWIQLEQKIDSLSIYQFAKKQGINIVPGDVFGEDRKYSNFIRINLGYPLDPQISKGIIALKNFIRNNY
ncbi:hypothetical protein P256_02574 [Acinetobacter nectaris CIP 110549]|uniref:Aminotransferase class I/classII large domain-containing protein n=1 Tax=Acinetobacter nectaris CIP 110549 TaxID=1392540 RepID=V2TEM3_9GAMM|nr:hypothetical protein P256_02574 [Acinetobacter nectaris CIP 110549]